MNKYEVRILVVGSVLIETVEATAYTWNELAVVFYVAGLKVASYNAVGVVSVTRITENKDSS